MGVVPFPAGRDLDQIASAIEAEVAAMAGAEEARWLRIGALLNEARTQFPGDREFGRWVEKCCTNLVQDDPNRMNRAAAMWAAASPAEFERMQHEHPKARTVRGWHAKWLEEVRPVERPTARPKANANRKLTPEQEQELVARYNTGTRNRKTLAETFGVGEHTVQLALAKEQGRREQEPVVGRDDLSLTAQKKFDAALRAYRRELDLSFEERVRQECERRWQEMQLPGIVRAINEARTVIKYRKGLMTKAQQRLILACLHPDNSASAEKRNEAFRLWNELEVVLLNEKEDPRTNDLPTTVEELLAKKAQFDAERAAKRAAMKAERAAAKG